MNFSVILFDGFETLDAFGPAEVIGKLERLYELEFYSEKGGIAGSSQNVRVETLPLSGIPKGGVVLIPGGFGTRKEVENEAFVGAIRDLAEGSEYVLTVCTGSGLLAKTGLLKGRKATSNKVSFDWAVEQDREVEWVRKARWVRDGKYYTSSGVSAGMDMILGFVRDLHGAEIAQRVARGIEYIWHSDESEDPFC